MKQFSLAIVTTGHIIQQYKGKTFSGNGLLMGWGYLIQYLYSYLSL